MNWNDWYRNVAHMERLDVVKAFESEAKLRERVQGQLARSEQEIDKLKSKLSNKERLWRPILIGSCHVDIDYARRRMGLNPNHVTYIYTSTRGSLDQLYGLEGNPEMFRFVRGWTRGRYAAEYRDEIVMRLSRDSRQLGIEAISYCPDPRDETI